MKPFRIRVEMVSSNQEHKQFVGKWYSNFIYSGLKEETSFHSFLMQMCCNLFGKIALSETWEQFDRHEYIRRDVSTRMSFIVGGSLWGEGTAVPTNYLLHVLANRQLLLDEVLEPNHRAFQNMMSETRRYNFYKDSLNGSSIG